MLFCELPVIILQKLPKQVFETNSGTLYFSPCRQIRAADCSALCCLNTAGGSWSSCGFTQGVAGPLFGPEFTGVDGFQVQQACMRGVTRDTPPSHDARAAGQAQRREVQRL
jgi:hypothetical protein